MIPWSSNAKSLLSNNDAHKRLYWGQLPLLLSENIPIFIQGYFSQLTTNKLRSREALFCILDITLIMNFIVELTILKMPLRVLV